MANDPAQRPSPTQMPWNTGPTGLGVRRCDWCGRDIHGPAAPCSATSGSGLTNAITSPGLGDRCKWELRTRGLAEPGDEIPQDDGNH